LKNRPWQNRRKKQTGEVVWRGVGKGASATNHPAGPRNFAAVSAQLKNNPPSEIAAFAIGALDIMQRRCSNSESELVQGFL
jgi:hypothetical protein